MTKFTYDWFNTSGRQNFADILIPEFKDKPFNYLEIGCFEGQATCWVLENLPLANVSVVDTFESGEDLKHLNYENLEKNFITNISNYNSKVSIYNGRSDSKLKTLPSQSFDFIYIDGSHMAKNVLHDAIVGWLLLKDGGIMAFDDYGWAVPFEEYNRPKMAIDSFLNCYETYYDLILKSYQVWVRRVDKK